MSRSFRFYIEAVLLAITVAVLCVPASAFATGESWQSAEVIASPPWSSSIDGTLTAVNYLNGFTDYEYWYSFTMSAGQTINVTATVPAGSDTDFYFSTRAFAHDGSLISDPFDSTHRRLAIMAPRTSTYVFEVFASAPGTFSIEATPIPPVKTSLSAFWVPKTPHKKKSFAVSVKLVPDYDSIIDPVRFYLERRSGGRWKKYGYVKGHFSTGDPTYSKFAAKLKLPQGTFRVRARFMDVTHPKALYTAWKTVRVR